MDYFVVLTRSRQECSRQVSENNNISLDSIKQWLTALRQQRPTQHVNRRVEARPLVPQASAGGSDVHAESVHSPSDDESIEFTSDDSSLTSVGSTST